METSRDLKDLMIEHDLLDPIFYSEQLGADAPQGRDALLRHYVEIGERAGLAPNADFDPAYYLRTNRDIADERQPTAHYLLHGKQEGRPSSLAAQLIDAQLDVVAVENRLIARPDVETGQPEYRQALARSLRSIDRDRAAFSSAIYIELYPDIKTAGLDPLLHYLRFGRHEGRTTNLDLLHRFHRNEALTDPHLPYILVGIHEASTTGAPMVGFDLARELSRTHNVIFVTLRDGPLLARAQEEFAVVVHASEIDAHSDIFISLITRDYVISDAIFSSCANLPFMRPLSSRNIRITCLVHEYLEYMIYHRAAVFVSDLLIFSSTSLLKSWQNLLDDCNRSPETVMVLPQPASPTSGRKMPKAEARNMICKETGLNLADAILVLGAGHIQIRKGTDFFLQIGEQLSRQPGKFVTVWIGEQASEFELTFGVWFHTQLERTRKPSGETPVTFIPAGPLYPVLMDAADVFVVTSRLDPLPNVALDAAARNIPVIAFRDATGLPDLAAKGEIDLIEVGMGAIDEMVAAIIACMAAGPQPATDRQVA